MAEMDRDTLCLWLLEHNVSFSRHAHIDILRELYKVAIETSVPQRIDNRIQDDVVSNIPQTTVESIGIVTQNANGSNISQTTIESTGIVTQNANGSNIPQRIDNVTQNSVGSNVQQNIVESIGIATQNAVDSNFPQNIVDNDMQNVSPNISHSEAIAIVVANEEAALDAEIRMLEKRRLIAQLRRELAEDDEQNSAVGIAQISSMIYVQHAVVAFSGNEVYDANKWLADFERVCASVDGDDSFRLKCVRRLMKPDTDAELFLRTDNSETYAEFRRNFIGNFGHMYSISEIIEKLAKTKFRPSETSVMGYILKMQEFAARANADEKHTVRCIIEGFRDKSVNVAVLYPA